MNKVFITRIALAMILLLSLASFNVKGQATVKTDLDDYPPGSTAIITGTGFQPGEVVELHVHHAVGDSLGTDPQNHQPWFVTADSLGGFTTSWHVPSVTEGDAYGATLLLHAHGDMGSVAEWTFTDGNAANGEGTMTISPTSVCTGSTGNSFTFTFTKPNGNDFNSGSQTTIHIPALWTQPQSSNSSNPGFITVTGISGGTASLGTITGTGPWTIPINMTLNANGQGFTVTYAGGGTKVTAPAAGSYTFTTQTKQNGGTLTTLTNGTSPLVTVIDNNTITLTSGVGTNAQTVCQSTAIANITYATTGATGATFSGLPTGVTGSFASNVVTIGGTPTTAANAGIYNYTVTLTGGCGTLNSTLYI